VVENNFNGFGVEMGEEEARRCRLDGGKERCDLVVQFSFTQARVSGHRRCMAQRRCWTSSGSSSDEQRETIPLGGLAWAEVGLAIRAGCENFQRNHSGLTS
jgi:hypothetical protein